MLNGSHKYLLDTLGFVRIPECVPIGLVNEAKSEISRVWGKSPPSKFPVLHAGRIFWKLLTHASVLDAAETACGEYFRLDHAFGLSSHGTPNQLHGGPDCSQQSCFFNWTGQTNFLVGQLSVGVVLSPQTPQTGGFCFVPGSHKSYDRSSTGAEVLRNYLQSNLNHEAIICPTLKPGDVVAFSESLAHGSRSWSGPTDGRLNLYYKFAPGWLGWRDAREQEHLKKFASTALEHKLLEGPWSGRFSEGNNQMGLHNERRTKTREVSNARLPVPDAG